jgi:hypothetical protein
MKLRYSLVAAARLRSWVQISPRAWMFVCCECCVLSGRGLCDELITRLEESYRLWCVVVCDLETSRMRRPWPALGRSATEEKQRCRVVVIVITSIRYFHSFTFLINWLIHYIFENTYIKQNWRPVSINVFSSSKIMSTYSLVYGLPPSVTMSGVGKLKANQLGSEIIRMYLLKCGSTRWRSWLRHCVTSRKVAGSIPDDVTGIFPWHNHSGRTMALGLTQSLR